MEQLHPLAVSAAEAARLLGVSRPMIYQLSKREDFPAGFKVGSRTLFSVAALETWVESQRKAVNP